ncbi:MAG: aminoacyl-tRNA hydrolase, partial [Kordiimonadaceae bacterium]|nr:aminoacyl-tRNA hydrolase [Kordiimonadaceae bacterium]
MIVISANISLRDDEVSFKAIRASGPGGQHVNTTASAVQLRFNAAQCPAISAAMLKRLRAITGRRITTEGILTLRAEAHSSQHRNR